MDIGYNVKISRHAIVDRTINPQGIHIGDNTIIAGNAIVLAHDHVRGIRIDTYIGRNCFLGGGSIIMPGVKLGNCVIVGAGAVVTRDVPDNCIVAGNPAKIIRKNIVLSDNVQIIDKGVKI